MEFHTFPTQETCIWINSIPTCLILLRCNWLKVRNNWSPLFLKIDPMNSFCLSTLTIIIHGERLWRCGEWTGLWAGNNGSRGRECDWIIFAHIPGGWVNVASITGQYFTLPLWFLQEWQEWERNWQEWERNPQEWDRNPQECSYSCRNGITGMWYLK